MANKQKITTINKKGLGARNWIINLILIGLFAFLMITFSTEFLVQNRGNNLNSDTNLNDAKTSLDTSLNYFAQAGNNTYGAFSRNLKPDPLQIFLIVPAILNTVAGMVYLPFSTIQAIFALAAGETPSPALTIVLSVVTGIMFFTIIFLIYKVARTGESER